MHLGKNAPVTQEAAGPVKHDSLAAESYKANGKFAENRDAEPEGPSYTTSKSSSSHARVEGVQGAPAPTYINSQFISDPHGPHGKNLKEEGFDHQQVSDGQRKAFKAEPGSIDDPGRLAEVKFEQRDAATPLAALNKDSGELSKGTAFDGLQRDVSA